MKPFVVRPFAVDPNAPQWRYFVLASLSYLLGICFGAVGLFALIIRVNEGFPFTWIGILALWLGTAFVAIGKLVRDNHKNHTELTKRLTEQDERIRRLEEQLAALTHSPKH